MPNKHVILVVPSQHIHVTAGENLGIGYLAAALRQQHYEVTIIDGWLDNLSPEEIVTQIEVIAKPLCVGISAYTSNMQDAILTVKLLRKKGLDIPTIAGGYGPTFYPVEFLTSGFNFVVRGEADAVLPSLCEYLLSGTPSISCIAGVSYKDDNGAICHNPSAPVTDNLDALPFPARDTIHSTIRQNNPVNILSSKGCLGRCAFCSIHTFQNLASGPRWRQRSILNFVDEVEYLSITYGVFQFKVVDDSIIEPPRGEAWCKELADEFVRRNLSVQLRGSIRANRVTDGVVRELRRAGFFCCACGIENFSPTALKRMNKGATVRDNIAALEVFRSHNMYVDAGSILFDDSTTLRELHENYEHMRQYMWIIGKIFTEMYAAQSTPFTNRLNHNNLLNTQGNQPGNYHYPILDPQAHKVYLSLKGWSKRYMQLYDMTVNPLRAFRTIMESELGTFHSLYMELREMELNAFGLILASVDNDMPITAIDDELLRHYQQTQTWYKEFEDRLRSMYRSSQLNYVYNTNPFV
jgi:anaerobic magnesium-protoporphyrin IX monomethyl ester cyclase